MAEPSGKKRLTLNLSLFTNLSESKPPILNLDSAKSPRNFEREVVGLGIVAAMNDSKDGSDALISPKPNRTAILAVSPRSQPIPICAPSSVKPSAKFVGEHKLKFFGEPMLEKDDTVLSESYTCVISNFGNNLMRKREYFVDKIDGSCDGGTTSFIMNSGVFSASALSHGEDYSAMVPFQIADFLRFCYLCKKTLHGLDIFMYRGEKAFCSAECRNKQISSNELTPFDCSASPCSSSPMQMFTQVVAA